MASDVATAGEAGPEVAQLAAGQADNGDQDRPAAGDTVTPAAPPQADEAAGPEPADGSGDAPRDETRPGGAPPESPAGRAGPENAEPDDAQPEDGQSAAAQAGGTQTAETQPAEARAQHDYEVRLAELGIVGASPSSGIV